MDAHIAQRQRLATLVRELCAKHRWAFRYGAYAATTKDSDAAVAALLVEYGGLPKGAARLNGVPAEVLERAVTQFATYFGLGGSSGNLRGTGSIPAEVDPIPVSREPQQAPW